MIIQCRQCRTKFRFDDSLMEGDGVWMRCSHCQHVFFQDNPQIARPAGQTLAGDEGATHETASLSAADMPEQASNSGREESADLFLNNVLKAKKGFNAEAIPEIEKPAGAEINDDVVDATGQAAAASEAELKKKKSSPKGFWKFLNIALWVILVIVAVPAIIYVYVFPQMGDRLVKMADKYLAVSIGGPARPEVVTGQIKLQDIRQRILNNYILGRIRIVEGTAVNQADYPVSRIVIKGEIVDAYSVVLGERTSYAGNVLTDEELTTLPEEEFLKRLNQPEGRSNSNDKIIQGGQIPFMIVFVHEPAGVIKTTVTTVGAERLL
jgi:predicted Zn finger-like uncharacterized protein